MRSSNPVVARTYALSSPHRIEHANDHFAPLYSFDAEFPFPTIIKTPQIIDQIHPTKGMKSWPQPMRTSARSLAMNPAIIVPMPKKIQLQMPRPISHPRFSSCGVDADVVLLTASSQTFPMVRAFVCFSGTRIQYWSIGMTSKSRHQKRRRAEIVCPHGSFQIFRLIRLKIL